MSPAILDSRKLLAFATLARVGSFTQAAREMNLTQSAVSHAIKALERDLNCRLFERMGRTVTIRGEAHTVMQAINRQVAHYAHHVGQIVLLAKHFAGDRWQTLSVPRNRSAEFTQQVVAGKASQR